ncbi:thioesterase domain-containing protein [Pedobacter sp. PF22-3]|uniref:thioesterase domain-containing protein n=1 Tax=Pedobacter sp. PF22-3 TaxID=2994467 RepID=UPI0022466B45|nr:thioesterase domain-containing protein [Pedobacter sp. PF22-3]MCX2492868.1 thioesterase domain-containing protein [Pedobacter sp. PF22-3]
MPAIDLIKVLDLLTRYGRQGIRISLSDDELLVKYPKKYTVTEELIEEIKANKAHLLEYFRYYDREFGFMDDAVETPKPFENLCGFKEPEKVLNSHLLLLNQPEKERPIFMLPGSGGKSGAYQELANCLNDVYSVYGLEMMGTQKGETPLKTVPEIASLNIQWIKSLQPHGPYRFIAHSFSAYVVFEMARQLEREGESIEFIAVLDQQIIGLSGLQQVPVEVNNVDIVMGLAIDYFDSFKILSPPYPDWALNLSAQLQNRPLEQMLPFITETVIKHMPHTTKIVEYVERLINIRIYNDTMEYVPEGTINAGVIVFKAMDNEVKNPDECLGWNMFSSKVEVYEVPGTHHNMVDGDHAVEIGRIFKTRMGLPADAVLLTDQTNA